MTETIVIKELNSEEEILKAYPLMKQLAEHIDEESYLDIIYEAKDKENYKMFALIVDGEIVAVTGFKPMITLYYGRSIWVSDLVTDTTKRSKGYGEKLLSYVHEWTKENNYENVSLSSAIQRTGAHRFYENKMGYDKVSYIFQTALN